MKLFTAKQIRAVRFRSLPTMAKMVDDYGLKIQTLTDRLSELTLEFQQAARDVGTTAGILHNEITEFVTKKLSRHAKIKSPSVRRRNQKVQAVKDGRKTKLRSHVGLRRSIVRNSKR
jgi:hypothetical protein